MRLIFNNREELPERQSLRAQNVSLILGCPSLHLAIEVDGESHAGEEARAHDEARLWRN